MKRALTAVSALGACVAAYLLLWPVPIDPESWQAPEPVEWIPSGDFANHERVEILGGEAPEDIEVDSQGRVYGGLHDGRILRWDTPTSVPDVFADTGGRPLGLHWDHHGNLLVADAWKGLLSISSDGTITTLATHCGGKELIFTDDLEIDERGTIWFSDATVKFHQPDWRLDIVENRPNGRVCAYHPWASEAAEVLDGLYFANGIAVDPDQQFILVNETSRYRVTKLWIAGPQAGKHEVIIDNLPGFPDGISTGSHGVFWIAIASPRNGLLDAVSGSPALRRMMVRLPKVLQPAPERSARAMGIDADGRVVHDLFDPTGSAIAVSTSVQERGGHLYLGSLLDHAWARIPTPEG